MRTLEEQFQVIRDAGYRLTLSRRAVMEVLAEAGSSLDVATIHRAGKLRHPSLGRVSVYRALDLLEKLGLARKVHGTGGCHGYAQADREEGHYLVCQGCGSVTEFPCLGLGEVMETVSRRFGFSVHQHLLQLEGLCTGCQPDR